MFENIGRKIMTLAEIVTWLGIIGFILYGLVIMAQDEDLIIVGFLVMGLGSLGSWIGSFLLYGFGQLIENTEEMIRILKSTNAIISYNENYARRQKTTKKATDEYYDNGRGESAPTPPSYIPPIDVSDVHSWRCSGCGKTITTDICPFCGTNSVTAFPFSDESESVEVETEAEAISDEDAIANAYLEGKDHNTKDKFADDDDSEIIDGHNGDSGSVKICRLCGAVLEEDSLFCTSCGNKL